MSKLNYSNIDVQRLLNVLSELFREIPSDRIAPSQDLESIQSETVRFVLHINGAQTKRLCRLRQLSQRCRPVHRKALMVFTYFFLFFPAQKAKITACSRMISLHDLKLFLTSHFCLYSSFNSPGCLIYPFDHIESISRANF